MSCGVVILSSLLAESCMTIGGLPPGVRDRSTTRMTIPVLLNTDVASLIMRIFEATA